MAPYDDPTLHHLGVDASSIDAASPLEQATQWLSAFEASISTGEIDSLVSLFHEYGFWRDILTLTWDIRTLRGHSLIRRMLDARLSATGLSAFNLLQDTVRGPVIIKPYPGLVFVRFCFEFETKHGRGTSVAFLVPTPDGAWKAWSLLTRLEALSLHPEKTGALREHLPRYEYWENGRRHETDFADSDPTVLIIGAGHCGLHTAARLTCLGVPTLVIDKDERIGDIWRKRYGTLRHHDTVWRNHMAYLDYPKTWPVYCPGPKFGDWLEFYATALDLNVWTSTSVTSTNFDSETRTWQVSVIRGGELRTLRVRHLVFATGVGGGFLNMPDIPGKETFHGSVLHSTQFTSAAEYEGKKVIIVGSGTSAHDVAHDLCHYGCDVTMIQRSPTYVISREAFESFLGATYNEHYPIDFADILSVALPSATLKYLLEASVAATANGIDKVLLDNLRSAGFQTYLGPHGAGLLWLIFERAGGFYIDTGTSQEIINGSIKVKSGSVRRFTERGVELEDETVLEADHVVFATGLGDIRSSIEQVCGRDVAERVGRVWGLDAEGELLGVWRRTGHPGLWVTMAGIGRSRLHSLQLALQIKAIEEGIIGDEEIWT